MDVWFLCMCCSGAKDGARQLGPSSRGCPPFVTLIGSPIDFLRASSEPRVVRLVPAAYPR